MTLLLATPFSATPFIADFVGLFFTGLFFAGFFTDSFVATATTAFRLVGETDLGVLLAGDFDALFRGEMSSPKLILPSCEKIEYYQTIDNLWLIN